MLRFQFSFTKATKFLWALPSANQWKKMCKDLLYGVSWQRWLLLRDWTELGAFVLCKGVKGTEWVTKNLWLGTTKIKKKKPPSSCSYLPGQYCSEHRGGKREHAINSEECLWCKVPFSGTSLGQGFPYTLFLCSSLHSKSQLSHK